MEIDKIIHEPTRLRIMMILAGLEQADFKFLVTTLGLTRGNLNRHMEKLESAGYPLGLTRGNLNRHMEKLESAGYLKVKRSFKGKIRNTSYRLTQKGSKALAQYWENLDAVRRSGQP